MSILKTRFFKNNKGLEETKRAHQFIRMFGSVSHELGLSQEELSMDLVSTVFNAMGDEIDNSTDIFIFMVLMFYSHGEGRGILVLKSLGNSTVYGKSVEDAIEDFSKSELKALYGIIYKVVQDMEEFSSKYDEKVKKEPVMLLISVFNYITRKIETYSKTDKRDIVPRLDIYQREM